MKITSIAIIFLVISCIAIFRTISKIKTETIGLRSGLTWIAIWSGISIFGIFPDMLNIAMGLVQMRNRLFFVLIMAVLILFAFVFNQATQMDNMNRNIRKLVQEIALLNYKLDKSDRHESDESE